MFSFFKKDKTPKYNELVWFSKAAKYEGVFKEVTNSRAQNKIIFIIAHFQETLDELSFILNKMNFGFQKISYLNEITEIKKGDTFVIQAENLNNDNHLTSLSQKLHSLETEFIILEHYPLFENDKALLENLQSIKSDQNAVFQVSLDEELFNVFGGERIKSVMEKMGMNEKESISHPMVSKSINRAQKKLENDLTIDIKAQSAKEWFEKNMSK